MASTDLILNKLFNPVDKAQWQQQVTADLKGRALDTLRWQTPEGFTLDPFYTAEDTLRLPLAAIQSAQTDRAPGWLTMPEITITPLANPDLLAQLRKQGADGFLLTVSSTPVQFIDWARQLRGLPFHETPIWFRPDGQADQWVSALMELTAHPLTGGLMGDPVAHRFRTGHQPHEAFSQLAEATRLSLDWPRFRTITADSSVFHNAGATATQELAFTLGSLVEQYDRLTDSGLTPAQLVPKTTVSIAVGTSYFTEIAKIRALRVLLQRLLTAYEPTLAQSSLFVHAKTSLFYNARVTPYANLLRTTTEAMAAVIGGCDALTVSPYNTVLGPSISPSEREQGERMARTISILLKEEAHLDKVVDPAAGAYYLEQFTAQLVEAAWRLFLQVEGMGGLLQAFRQGFVQETIDQAYKASVQALKKGRVMVGVNQFRHDEGPVAINGLATDNAPVRPESGASLLVDRRLAEEFE